MREIEKKRYNGIGLVVMLTEYIIHIGKGEAPPGWIGSRVDNADPHPNLFRNVEYLSNKLWTCRVPRSYYTRPFHKEFPVSIFSKVLKIFT